MRFALSTHLYHAERLTRAHLVEIARHGFEHVELFATRSHFDYRDPAAIDALGEWLRETGLRLYGLHAPLFERYGGEPGAVFSTAAPDAAERGRAVREIDAALEVARRIRPEVLVVHLATPQSQRAPAGEPPPGAAIRSLEEIHALTAPLGVRVAIEVIPNTLSTPASLVRLLEEDLDLGDAGICLDFGHARLLGDVVDAIETVSGHLITTHLHDNHGTHDDHLVPFEGAIDWTGALMSVQKIGYDGMLVLEVGSTGAPDEVLARTARARDRLARMIGG